MSAELPSRKSLASLERRSLVVAGPGYHDPQSLGIFITSSSTQAAFFQILPINNLKCSLENVIEVDGEGEGEEEEEEEEDMVRMSTN